MIRFAALLILGVTLLVLGEIATESAWWSRWVSAAKKRAREIL